MPESNQRGKKGKQKRGNGTSTLEWIVAGISAVLVLGAIGFLFYEALSDPATPPDIRIEVEQIYHHETGYLVDFEVYNRGQTTAASLVVEGELKSDSGSVEKASVTIDYVPAEAMRRAGLFFTHDPRQYELDINPKGYDRP